VPKTAKALWLIHVQSFAAELLARMGSDYESPSAARQSFMNGLEARAKRETYPPITDIRPGYPQPIRLAGIVGSLNKAPLVDACFPKLVQIEARVAERNAAKQRAAVEQQRREAELLRKQEEQRAAVEQQKREEEAEFRRRRESDRYVQQGPRLVGSSGIGSTNQGKSVALSADGNTAIVGGPGDDSLGAAWVFTRIAGFWTQQGPKLVGSGSVGGAWQGTSVAFSADGNTAIVGGYGDSDDPYDLGAAWVFTRTSGVWAQQGASWSVRARLDKLHTAPPSESPQTAIPTSWADLVTMGWERHGCPPDRAGRQRASHQPFRL
jgi:hypothetical protein